MIPKPYATSVSIIQAGVAITAIVCLTVAAVTGSVSGDAFVAIVSGIAGAVLGTASTVAGANGVASRIQQATETAVGGTRVTEQRKNPPE